MTYPTAPIRLTVAALALAVPTLAAAQETVLPDFVMPEGCDLVVIVQSSNCTATVTYTCADAEPGVRHLATIYEDGFGYYSEVGPTYLWLMSFNMFDGDYQETILPAADPIDIGNLLENGIDSLSFSQVERSTGRIINWTGYDWLSGFDTTIDGVLLLETTFHVRGVYEDGTPYYEAEGTEYLDPELVLFYQGRSWYDGDPNTMSVTSPVEFVFPGEENDTFYAPLYGCSQ